MNGLDAIMPVVAGTIVGSMIWLSLDDLQDPIILLPVFVAIMFLTVTTAIYLYIKQRQKETRQPPERTWPGHAIDVAPMAKRIDRLRTDYLAELTHWPPRSQQPSEHLKSARNTVRLQRYFRRRRIRFF